MGEPQPEPRVLSWEGTEPVPDIPDENFAVFMLKQMAATQRDTVAMVNAETGQQRTYGELCDLVPRVSAGLAAAGVRQGDKVIYYSINHIDYPLMFLSVLYRGATCVPMSPLYEKMKEDLLHALKVTGAQWAVVHSSLLQQAEATYAMLPPDTLKKLWVLDGAAGGHPSFTDLMAYEPLPPLTKEDGLDHSTAISQVPFSSGTTGPRKGIMTSHRIEVTRMITTKYLADLGEKAWLASNYTTCLLVTSLAHSYPHVFCFNTLMFGGTVLIIPHYTATTLLEYMEKHKVTFAALVPIHLKMILESPVLQQTDFSSLKQVISAGAKTPDWLAASFREKVCASLYNFWGMTETMSVCAYSPITDKIKPFCVGKLMPLYELKVVDEHTREMVGAGRCGELCVRSPTLALGYLGSTATLKDAEGWMSTGDYGYFDDQGDVYITDRIKELIKTLMHLQLQPSEIECLLLKHPDVEEAVVVGIHDENLGELPRAYLVLKKDATAQPHLLKEFVNTQVPDFKQLTGGVWVLEAMPRNPTGKVLRRKLQSSEVTPLAHC